MLGHENINVHLNTPYHKGFESIMIMHFFVYNDEFYQFKYGILPFSQ